MRKMLLVTAAMGGLILQEAPSFAQGFRFGPGGVEIDDGRGYREDREERRYRGCAESFATLARTRTATVRKARATADAIAALAADEQRA